MKILITGFEPFGGEKINPAWEAVNSLPSKIDDIDIFKLQLPTVFRASGLKLFEAIDLLKPDVVICVGQAGGRFDFCVERIAINIDDGRIPDNNGHQPIDETIFKDGENAYFSTLPIKAIVEEVKKAGIPASVSNTAGTYVCNHIFYQVQYMRTKEFPKLKAGFIHIPFLPEQVITRPNQPSMALADIVKGLTAAIGAIVERDGQSDIKAVEGQNH